MYIAKQKLASIEYLSQLGVFSRAKALSSSVGRFASDFCWAYRTVFPTNHVNYERQSRFLLRTIFNLQPSACWFRYVKESYLRDIASKEPSLLEAVHRPFFDRNITSTKRVRLLKSHFEEFQSIFGPHQALNVMIGDRVSLCKMEGKSGENFVINLVREDAYKREGGVTLELSMNNIPLLCLTFTLETLGREILIKVGGIQSKGLHCRDATRDATHALHGIQPRLLLIEALRAIAIKINCTNIECISKENHIHRSWRYRFKKTINAEYNQLWLLAGGKENPDGNFDIPSVIEEKSIDERPSKKRAEYRRRATLLDLMRQQIHQEIIRADVSPRLVSSTILWTAQNQNLSYMTSVANASNDSESYLNPVEIMAKVH
ncbi:DUF535 family protein [Undibacterium sp. RTI2.1]|uniref:VirK/YbjX family protein n=1 Tax=unclassified Undibacterium TaxID=2630295 RepID=UPI002AB5579B|nr:MULTISPECIES: DUF535 family protein [unclassified Undibacterium]MDY7536855.1 DUF535 family protein [Undibacterium sp. 5I1]MEB0029480.1 DUF535 family protein [Undibacterium sp. RTI2.1]MEB0115666.1 DUF535 family protein [Undibacterium sp. RTI2.2]MEB0233218.1 DUF535 family protein [Undibacterium sp. 10I3]MEB0256737.1 DUF535 family protein [Undibacterium sp. 5I1]